MKEHLPFWNRVKQILKQQKKTFDEFGKEIGIDGHAMRLLIARDRLPKLQDAFSIAKGLDVSLEFLIDGKLQGQILDKDILDVISTLQLLDQKKREPIIALVKQQVKFWKNS